MVYSRQRSKVLVAKERAEAVGAVDFMPVDGLQRTRKEHASNKRVRQAERPGHS